MAVWKKTAITIVLLAVCALLYGIYLYTKKQADVRVQTPVAEMTAAALVGDFSADETAAGKKYIDQAIVVKGKIAEIKTDTNGEATVILESGDPLSSVTCSFYDDEMSSVQKLKVGQEVSIKGICTGKLADVILNKCSIEIKN